MHGLDVSGKEVGVADKKVFSDPKGRAAVGMGAEQLGEEIGSAAGEDSENEYGPGSRCVGVSGRVIMRHV